MRRGLSGCPSEPNQNRTGWPGCLRLTHGGSDLGLWPTLSSCRKIPPARTGCRLQRSRPHRSSARWVAKGESRVTQAGTRGRAPPASTSQGSRDGPTQGSLVPIHPRRQVAPSVGKHWPPSPQHRARSRPTLSICQPNCLAPWALGPAPAAKQRAGQEGIGPARPHPGAHQSCPETAGQARPLPRLPRPCGEPGSGATARTPAHQG